MFNAFYKTFMVSSARKTSSPSLFFVSVLSSFRQKRLLLFFLVSSRKLVFVAWFPFFFHLCVNLYKTLETFSSDVYYYSAIYYHRKQSNTSVYVGVIIAGALVGEKMVNKGFDSMWESRNKGKLFKDLKLPDAEE